ncbi:MAG: coaE operon protein [Euryarchaeota archaeon]|nr:coaE operon protein [Euryarchaeota archaeon]
MPDVRVRAPVKPSEDPRKVEKAVRTVFPDAVLEAQPRGLVATTRSLQHFRDLIWRAKILDAARRVLLGSLDEAGRHARFSLSKQAAFGGHVSFAVAEAPLGDLEVDVTGEGLDALFREIAPPTLRGRPVSEEEYERHLEKRRKLRVAKPAPAAAEEE